MAQQTRGNDAPSVSVIVPIYNVEAYLQPCLESLHAQTLQDMEILLVDDGSTDASPELLAAAAAADARMRVITKQNGGYGQAVNVGLAQARGRYIGIVESDDFVDHHMYEELLAAAQLADGTYAQVVKSAYWNYYDLEDGSAPYIEPSNLMKNMPDEPCVINVHKQFRVLFQHPSIWSALYKRAFLEERSIRMKEIPGAGWADNPFFYETLVQAEHIAWTPCAYYYYRQTNPGSSSYLKDYHIPFDRMRDVRELFARIGEDDPTVLACLYNREFYYIRSVLENYRFPETDPELFALIVETLQSMDKDVLYGAKHGIRREYIDYYEDVMGIARRSVKAHARVRRPKLSVIVAMKDVRPYVFGCFASLAAQTLESIEVIAIDCGSRDRSADVAEYFSGTDKRFMTIRAEGLSIPQGFRMSAVCASGEAIMFLDPRDKLDKKLLSRIARALDECPNADMLLFAKDIEYLPASVLGGRSVPTKRAIDVAADGLRSRLMIAVPNTITNKVMRMPFYQSLENVFDADEGSRCSLASTMAIAHAERVALMNVGGLKRQSYHELAPALAYVEKASALEDARRTKFELVAAYVRRTGDADLERGFCCYVVESILRDVSELEDVEEERAYLTTLQRDCLEPYGLLARAPSTFHNIASFRQLQRLAFMEYERYMEQETMASRRETKRVSESATYRVGRTLADIGTKLVPSKLANAVRKQM